MQDAINDSSVQFPRHQYTMRLLKHEFMLSKRTSNPMVKMDWEIAAPDTKRLKDGNYVCAGIIMTNYLMLNLKKLDESKKWLAKAGVRIEDLTAEKIENEADNIDWSPLDNLCILTIAGSVIKPQKGQEWDEEKQRLVEVDMVDADGKSMTSWEFSFQLQAKDLVGPVEPPVRTAPF